MGLDFIVLLLILIPPLSHLRRRLCVCTCIRLDMFFIFLSLSLSFSLSLSLSLLPLEVSVYLSIFYAHLPSNVSAIKAKTGALLAAAP